MKHDVLGVIPLLCDASDQYIKNILRSSRINSQTELFDVTLDLMYGDDIAHGFDYANCRIVEYVMKTEHDLKEIFYKGFVLTNEFHFECLGYIPFDSVYDALSEISKAYVCSSIN